MVFALNELYQNTLMKSIYMLLFALTIFTIGIAQDEKKSGINDLLQSKSFVFKAQTVIPAAGSSRHLTSDYDVRVTPESVVSYLPYFGRAYTAPLDPQKAGHDFTSKAYDYILKERRKGGWELIIRPRDVSDIRSLNFVIFDNGNATLQISSNSKQTISYSGAVANAN